MFVQTLSKDAIKIALQPIYEVFEEIVIPLKVDLLANNAYAEKYAWMYSFEKRLKYRIEGILKRKLSYAQEKVLFGAGGAVSEGLSNSYAHGHKKDARLAISVWVCVSKKGLGVSITDQGTGFDYPAILNDFHSGESFFHIAGNGFTNFYTSEQFSVCYQQAGRELCILVPF